MSFLVERDRETDIQRDEKREFRKREIVQSLINR